MIPYPFLRFTDTGLSEWEGGHAKGPWITIRPKYRDDQGLIAHESFHAYMWWLTLGIMGILTYFRPFKLWSEVRAYRIQMKYPNYKGVNMTLDEAAKLLCNPKYGFNLTLDQAKEMLRG